MARKKNRRKTRRNSVVAAGVATVRTAPTAAEGFYEWGHSVKKGLRKTKEAYQKEGVRAAGRAYAKGSVKAGKKVISGAGRTAGALIGSTEEAAAIGELYDEGRRAKKRRKKKSKKNTGWPGQRQEYIPVEDLKQAAGWVAADPDLGPEGIRSWVRSLHSVWVPSQERWVMLRRDQKKELVRMVDGLLVRHNPARREWLYQPEVYMNPVDWGKPSKPLSFWESRVLRALRWETKRGIKGQVQEIELPKGDGTKLVWETDPKKWVALSNPARRRSKSKHSVAQRRRSRKSKARWARKIERGYEPPGGSPGVDRRRPSTGGKYPSKPRGKKPISSRERKLVARWNEGDVDEFGFRVDPTEQEAETYLEYLADELKPREFKKVMRFLNARPSLRSARGRWLAIRPWISGALPFGSSALQRVAYRVDALRPDGYRVWPGRHRKNPKASSLSTFQDVLAHLRALQWVYLTTHWTSAGPNAYGDHLLLQRLYEGLDKPIDALGERMVAYFGPQAVDPRAINRRVASILEDSQTKLYGPTRLDALFTVERELQKAVRMAWRANQDSGDEFSLGIDDFLMSLSNERDEAIYLLKQRLR